MSNAATIIARLKLCDDEITQLKQRHEYPPLTIDGDTDSLPMAYHEPLGLRSESNDAGTAEEVWRIRKSVIVDGVRNNEVDTNGESVAVKNTTAVMDAVRTYYNDHRRLHTAALGNLARVWRDIDFEIQTGEVASEGTRFLGFTMVITVYIRANATRNY